MKIPDQIKDHASALWVNLRKVLPIYVLWLVAVVGVGMVSVATLPAPNNEYNPSLSPHALVSEFGKWDSRYYLEIAQQGYAAHSGQPAFYPLYPALIRLVHDVTHQSYLVSGIAVSAASALVAFVMLYLLALDYFKDEERSRLTLLVFAFSPAALFLLTVYTEALFCALAFTAYYLARKRRWLWAGLALGALTATRLPGIVFAGAIFLEYLSSIKWQIKNVTREVLYFALAPLGFVAYAIYLQVHLHDPLMMFHAYHYGWHFLSFNPNIFAAVFHDLGKIVEILTSHAPAWPAYLYIYLLGVGAWLLGLTALIMGLRKWPISYSALVAAALLMYSLNSNFTAVDRYILPLFPIYLIIVQRFSKATVMALIPFSAMFMSLLFILFTHNNWAG